MAELTAAKTVDELAKQLQNAAYTNKTTDQLRTEAENMYRNQLEQAKLSAQQSYDTNANALQNQLAALETDYARQRENQQKATVQAKASADRQALSRGMQRSSYNNATLANLDVAGNKALAQIDQNRTNDVNTVNSQLTLLKNQLSQNLASAQSTYENSVLAKLQELQDQQYQRQKEYESIQNELAFQLYELQKAEEEQAKASSSSGGGTRRTSTNVDDQNTLDDFNLDNLFNLLNPVYPSKVSPWAAKVGVSTVVNDKPAVKPVDEAWNKNRPNKSFMAVRK